jgi:hypothetical protein
MSAHSLVHRVNLIESFLDRLGAGGLAGKPDGKENGVEAAFAHAGDVNIAVGVAGADVESRIEEALRGVIVGVNDDRGGLEFLGFVGNRLRGRGDDYTRETEGEQQERAEHESPE